jgi:selenocysteine-specific elongation factor
MMPHIIVGTAGHIDHGKTALVKALTGIDADRLKEEKERGITIDLGFANLALDDGTAIGFVDVPGHERFIKNMLAGVGGIDVVLLVVAADESVMPQTREHLEICSLLRIQRGLTVLTKIDAADPEIAELAEVEAHELVKGTFLEGAPVLRVSSLTGEGLPQLVEALRTCAAEVAPKDPARVFRLPIDRAFTMRGFGTVVSGTLVSGRVRRDDEVEVLPRRQPARVRGIQVHGAAVEEASAGMRTALNLQRVELADVERGMVLAPPGALTPAASFDVHLELLASAPAPIVRRKRVRFHAGTAEIMGHVVLLGQDMLEPGDTAFARIRLERSTVALPGDRFIVRQYSPMVTLGGGEILDAQPPRHRRADPAVRDRLAALQRASPEERVLGIVEDTAFRTADVPAIVSRLGILPEQATGMLRSLARDARIRVVADAPLVVVSTGVFQRLCARLLDEVRAFHEDNPLLAGVGREDLRGRLPRDVPAALFRAAIDQLQADKRLAAGHDIVHAFGRTVTLGEEDARVRELLAARYRALGLQAPSPDNVIAALALDPATARGIVQLMIRDQALVRVSDEMTVDREALRGLIENVRALKSSSARFGVKEFKELTGLSRKFAVPLLEYLDGQRVTRRVGDERVIL